MIPGSRILVEKSSSVSLPQNGTSGSLPNPVSVSGAGGHERKVCSYVKNGGCWHDYPGHLRKQEVQRLVAGSAQFFLDNMGIERSLMWQFQERNLNSTQRWAQVHSHTGKSHSLNLHCSLSLSHYHVFSQDNRNQRQTANPWEASPWSLHLPPHTASSQLKIQYSTW